MSKSPEKHSITTAGLAITFAGAVLFSTKAIIVKLAFAATAVDALTLLTLRMVFSLPFYLIIAFFVSNRQHNQIMNLRQWATTIVVGLLGYYASSYFDFVGLQYISAGLERLILFLYPTFAVFINSVIFKHTISRAQQMALLLTYIGIGLAYYAELQFDINNPNFLWGSFLVFLCSVTYSLYIVGSGRIIPQVGATKFTAYAMLSATIGIFVHFLFTKNISALGQSHSFWWYGIFLAIVATVVPSFLISNGMKRIGSNNVAIISSIGPVSTIIQAHYILGEPILWQQIAGTALVVSGVLILGWRTKSSI